MGERERKCRKKNSFLAFNTNKIGAVDFLLCRHSFSTASRFFYIFIFSLHFFPFFSSLFFPSFLYSILFFFENETIRKIFTRAFYSFSYFCFFFFSFSFRKQVQCSFEVSFFLLCFIFCFYYFFRVWELLRWVHFNSSSFTTSFKCVSALFFFLFFLIFPLSLPYLTYTRFSLRFLFGISDFMINLFMLYFDGKS